MNSIGHILWVDDEIHHLKPHILFLETKGYKVSTATNGNDADVLSKDNKYDLILLDQTMPGIDGIDTLKKIKKHRLSIPIIMITKSEDEWLMDEAISNQVNQFIIKPVSPNQVLIACKQILEKNKIIETKTTTDYLKDFKKINEKINDISSSDDWWDLYLRLIKWELKFDKYGDSGLNNILNDQIQSCNKVFSNYYENNYQEMIKKDNNSVLSPSVFQNHLLPCLKENQKVCLIVVDCMRCDQFISVIPFLESLFDIELTYHMSLIPSATPYSRNAIFSGLFPDELINKYPDQKKLFLNNESGLNKFENVFLLDQLKRYDLLNKKLHYHKIWAIDEGKRFRKKINDYLNKDIIALVVNFVDMLAHDSSKMEVLKEIVPDEAGYRLAVKSWFENSWFNDILRQLSKSEFEVVITSDHGSIRVNRDIMVSADKDASSGIRYKYGRNLNTKNKNAFVIKEPEKYRLPILGPQFNYLIAKDDAYFVYPNDVNRYKNKLNNSFQHGGISMEEILVPVLKMKGYK